MTRNGAPQQLSVAARPTIFIFDIDLTLIRSSGAGKLALNRAFAELYGVAGAFDDVDVAGRTDGAIIRDAFATGGQADTRTTADLPAFRERYLRILAEELAAEGTVWTLPGVVPLLDALAARSDVVLGLGTGNFRAAAALKLQAVGLWHRFVGGGFADDGDERADLIAAAVRRLRRAARGAGGEPRIWVIGDTPHDVSAARANGLPVLGVGTGRASLDQLRAAGATCVLPNLSDTELVVRLVLPERDCSAAG